MPPELFELRLELLDQAADGLEIDVLEIGHGVGFSWPGRRSRARLGWPQGITGSLTSLRSSPARAPASLPSASLRSGIGYAPVKQAEQ
jgi:hypothetical protein